MSCAVEVEHWPRDRRTERDVRSHFGSFGEVRSVELRHGLVLVRYASADAARAAVRILHGSRPAGCDEPLSLRAACDHCAALSAEVDSLREQLAAAQRGARVARAPPPRVMPPPKRQRSQSPAPSYSDHQGGAAPASVFFQCVHDRLGERAAHHLSKVLPQRVMTTVVASCDRALVYPGKHWMVPDRRAFVNEMRHAITAPGVLSIFFDWSGFRLVVFVDNTEVDRAAIADMLQAESFVTRFGDFDVQSCSDVLLV